MYDYRKKAKKIAKMFRYVCPYRVFDKDDIEQKLRQNNLDLAIATEVGLTILYKQKKREEAMKQFKSDNK